MAHKLSISESDAILIWTYNRGFANKLVARKLYVLMGELIERFKLDDKDVNHSYGEQLVLKGVLNSGEALMFSQGQVEDGVAQRQTA